MVETEIVLAASKALGIANLADVFPDIDSFSELPTLNAEDIADAVLYALSTPPHVQVHELTIKPVGEPF